VGDNTSDHSARLFYDRERKYQVWFITKPNWVF